MIPDPIWWLGARDPYGFFGHSCENAYHAIQVFLGGTFMGRMFMVCGVAVLLSLGLGHDLQAQKFKEGPGSKVAMINIGKVFRHYYKAISFKKETEEILHPYKDKSEQLKKDMTKLQKVAENPNIPGQDKEDAVQKLIEQKRKLEDLEREARRVIGKRNEDQIILLYKDISSAAEKYARANDFYLVLAYGEPLEGDLFSFANLSRKMQAMDTGSVTPLFIHPTVDISDPVVQVLNKGYDASLPATPVSEPKK
jgi:Skp family chaperone for outer membrane proteins